MGIPSPSARRFKLDGNENPKVQKPLDSHSRCTNLAISKHSLISDIPGNEVLSVAPAASCHGNPKRFPAIRFSKHDVFSHMEWMVSSIHVERGPLTNFPGSRQFFNVQQFEDPILLRLL
jgi:hypothetical protein